jgi:diguanylate cyclase (GGDEF)-like protein
VIGTEACDQIRSAVAIVDAGGRIRNRNRGFEDFFHKETLPIDTLTGIFGSEAVAEFFRTEILAAGKEWSGVMEGEFGGWIDCYPLETDEESGLFTLFFDTSGEREKLIGRMAGKRQYDSVTGLPNLSAFHEVFQARYLRGGDTQTFGALFLVAFDDIYRFDYRDGSAKGDKVLIQLAEKINEMLEEGDYLAYIGSDKFVYVRQEIRRVHEAEEVARKLLQLNTEPIAVEGELFYLNLSIGIAFYPFDGEEAAELVRLADRAMRESKLSGWNRFAFYSQLRTDAPLETLDHLRKALPEAIERENLYFVYQPQYCLKRKRFVGAEMLARWRHPELGELLPEVFLPLAEQTGMIRFLTIRALTQASKMFEKLKAMGEEEFSLSINLSPAMIFHRDFLENLEFFLEHYGLREAPLHLEITENVFAHNLTVMRRILENLRKMGIKVEIDDYGTGYTSLSTLVELPVDTVKIDRQYVKDIDRDHKTRTLYKAILHTAEALGLGVVAEGVERHSEREVVESHGAVVIQGWYCAKVMGEEDLLKLLERNGEEFSAL